MRISTTSTRRRLRAGSFGEEGGAAMVEFALVLPLLAVLLFGMIEFGRAVNYWIDGTHLANAAARWAAVDANPGPGGSLQESMRMQADTAELREGGTTSVPSAAQVCISFPDGTRVGDRVEATVSVDYNWMPLIGDALGDVTSTTLTGSATMRLEQVPEDVEEGCS